MNFSGVGFHRDFVVSKVSMPRLPPGFKQTDLGYPRDGATAQYRGPSGLHAHEFPTHWSIHRDYGDPSTLDGLVTHLARDAPEVAFGVVAGLAVGSHVYNKRKAASRTALTEALVVGGLCGLLASGVVYLLTHADG